VITEQAKTDELKRDEFKRKAEEELRKTRENCQKYGVSFEIKNIREYVAQAGLSLADIGTSEEELQNCFKAGHINVAKTWLNMAKERCESQDVSTEIGHIRNLIAEANVTLADMDTSEEELERLLAAYKPITGWWRRLFPGRNGKYQGSGCCSLHPKV
jgi:hypothetical protein